MSDDSGSEHSYEKRNSSAQIIVVLSVLVIIGVMVFAMVWGIKKGMPVF